VAEHPQKTQESQSVTSEACKGPASAKRQPPTVEPTSETKICVPQTIRLTRFVSGLRDCGQVCDCNDRELQRRHSVSQKYAMAAWSPTEQHSLGLRSTSLHRQPKIYRGRSGQAKGKKETCEVGRTHSVRGKLSGRYQSFVESKHDLPCPQLMPAIG